MDTRLRSPSTNMANILCGCQHCKQHGAPFRGILDPCLHVLKYENDMWEKGVSRLEGKDVDVKKPDPIKEFRPASRAQIDGWIEDLKKMKEFYETPEGKAEQARREKHIEDAIKTHKNVKFDLVSMEKWLNERVWPEQRPEFMSSNPTWIAYVHYGKEQNTLLSDYNSLKDTDEDYDKAEKAYQALLRHIGTHGDLIRAIPKKSHKQSVKTSAVPTHVGRRAARHARNASESSSGKM